MRVQGEESEWILRWLRSLRSMCGCTKDLCCHIFFSCGRCCHRIGTLYAEDLVLTSEIIEGLENKLTK